MDDVAPATQVLCRGDYFPLQDGRWAKVMRATPHRITARYFDGGRYAYREYYVDRDGDYICLRELH